MTKPAIHHTISSKNPNKRWVTKRLKLILVSILWTAYDAIIGY
jgi:hypothetical protein